MKQWTLLLVDDEPRLRRVLELAFEEFGYRVLTASDRESGARLLREQAVDLVLADLQLPDGTGLDLLRELREGGSDAPFICITAFGTVETAVQAMKLGAFDYVLKPFQMDEIQSLVARALELRRSTRENAYFREAQAADFEGMVAESAEMRAVIGVIERVAATDATVLVTGETGTGKELVAHAIHARSARAAELFVPINCAAIPGELLEAELFGVTRGAFTGAVADRPGKFEIADGGTLFLDEIGDMPLAMQAKLLRALQEGTIERLGSGTTRRVDVRIIAATHRDLERAVAAQAFRADLYYRLNVVPIALPPLRARQSDIAPLAVAAATHFARRLGRSVQLGEGAVRTLLEYHWPGNVRELRNVIERAVILSEGSVIESGTLALPRASSAGTASVERIPTLEEAVSRAERQVILAALDASQGNKTAAAELLGVSIRTLFYKLDRLGLRDQS